jgi:hypothetical protein
VVKWETTTIYRLKIHQEVVKWETTAIYRLIIHQEVVKWETTAIVGSIFSIRIGTCFAYGFI